jgi:hypothetical protein
MKNLSNYFKVKRFEFLSRPYLAALLLAWSDYHLEDAAQLNEKFIFIQNGASFFFEIIEKTLHLFVEKPLQEPEIKTV